MEYDIAVINTKTGLFWDGIAFKAHYLEDAKRVDSVELAVVRATFDNAIKYDESDGFDFGYEDQIEFDHGGLVLNR